MASTDSVIEFEQIGIGNILDRYRLHVPKYQRDYAWTAAEVTSFLQDITLAIQTDESQYFLGTIVTIRRNNDVLEVVDGQQRLATTALLMSAMRVLVGDSNANLRSLISDLLTSIDVKTLQEEAQISLNFADNDVFKSLIVDGKVGNGFIKTRNSHVLLSNAFEAAKAHLQTITKGVAPENAVTVYQQWIEYFTSKVKTILLRVSDDASAFTMFETLNDRGLSVSQADLIKNYVFSESDDHITQVQQHWTSIKSALETVEDGNTINFIWHALIATTGFVEQKKIYERVKKTIKGKNSSIAQLAHWEKLAKYYVGIFNPNGIVWADYPEATTKQLQVLDLFDIQPFKPILMACAVQMSKAELPLAYSRMVSIGVRLIIASRTTTQSVFKALSDAAYKIWMKEIKTAKQLVAFLSPNIPNDDQFRAAFEIATVPKAKFARYYLRSLERVAKGVPSPWEIPNEDPSAINLEHILPINPGKHWPNFSPDQVDAFSKRLGNMVLIKKADNKKLGNGNFSQKKPILKSAPYQTTSMVAAYSDWTPENLEKRQKKLAIYALKAWPLKT